MISFLDGETRPALTLPSRIGWQIHYSEIIFDDPPYLLLQAVPVLQAAVTIWPNAASFGTCFR